MFLMNSVFNSSHPLSSSWTLWSSFPPCCILATQPWWFYPSGSWRGQSASTQPTCSSAKYTLLSKSTELQSHFILLPFSFIRFFYFTFWFGEQALKLASVCMWPYHGAGCVQLRPLWTGGETCRWFVHRKFSQSPSGSSTGTQISLFWLLEYFFF